MITIHHYPTNQIPCVYLAIDRDYVERDRLHSAYLVKVGLSRSMQKRRCTLRYQYDVETVWEIPANNKTLEIIEAHLIYWLQHYPTAIQNTTETAYIDTEMLEALINNFPTIVKGLNAKFPN